jgi:hypothetical protein
MRQFLSVIVMKTKYLALIIGMLAIVVLISGCTGGQQSGIQTVTPPVTSTPTALPSPVVSTEIPVTSTPMPSKAVSSPTSTVVPSALPVQVTISPSTGSSYDISVTASRYSDDSVFLTYNGGSGSGMLSSFIISFKNNTGIMSGPAAPTDLTNYGVTGDMRKAGTSLSISNCRYPTHVIVTGVFSDGYEKVVLDTNA